MPRDVHTRWNSTYDMIEFALVYRQVIDKLTSERGLGLRDFEMDVDEWEIAAQLSEILKVSVILQLLCRRANLLYSYSRCNTLFLKIQDIQHNNCDSCNGSLRRASRDSNARIITRRAGPPFR